MAWTNAWENWDKIWLNRSLINKHEQQKDVTFSAFFLSFSRLSPKRPSPGQHKQSNSNPHSFSYLYPYCHRAIFLRLFYTRFSLSFFLLCQLLSLFSPLVSLLSMFPHCYRLMTLTTSQQYPFIVTFILFFIHSL